MMKWEKLLLREINKGFLEEVASQQELEGQVKTVDIF